MKKTNNKNKIIFLIVVFGLFIISYFCLFIVNFSKKANENNISHIIDNDLADNTNSLESQNLKQQESLASLENYKEFKNTEFRIQSQELKNVIDSDWEYDKDFFGTKESRYNYYDIFFDEGIEIKTVNGKIYNIIFNKNYIGNVFNNLNTGMDLKEIESVLGKSTFAYEETIGYKNGQIYAIFNDGNISIYRNQEYEYEKFLEYFEKYLNNEINVKKFINELTYLWPDYSEYNYDSNYVYLNYAKQGIELYLTADNQDIIIYGNCTNIDLFKPYINNGQIIAKLQQDGIFEYDCKRIKYNIEQAEKDFEELGYEGKSNKFNEKVLDNKVEFYSLDSEFPNCTLNESITSYFWLEDTIFIYSIAGKGIYNFDLNDMQSYELFSGEDNFEFKNFENGIITYDDENILEIGSE